MKEKENKGIIELKEVIPALLEIQTQIRKYISHSKFIMEVTPDLKKDFKDVIPICLFCRKEMKENIYSYDIEGEPFTYHIFECKDCKNNIFIYQKIEMKELKFFQK